MIPFDVCPYIFSAFGLQSLTLFPVLTILFLKKIKCRHALMHIQVTHMWLDMLGLIVTLIFQNRCLLLVSDK